MKVKNWFVIATLCAVVIAQFAPAKDKPGRTLVPANHPDRAVHDLEAFQIGPKRDVDSLDHLNVVLALNLQLQPRAAVYRYARQENHLLRGRDIGVLGDVDPGTIGGASREKP